jgi:hypothetical protein
MPRKSSKPPTPRAPPRYESLPVVLSPAELADRAKALAAHSEALGDPLEKVKRLTKEVKEGVAGEVQRVLRLSRVVTTGKEDRDVQVSDEWDWKNKVVATTRHDTGETVRSRAMTREELEDHAQLVLPGDPAAVKYAGETTEDNNMPPRADDAGAEEDDQP